MDEAEFWRTPWRIRAVKCENVTIEGDSAFANEDSLWMWFVGDPAYDEWFAHGISDICDETMADKVAESIDHTEMVALLSYAGETWEDITTVSPALFGSKQRLLYTYLREGNGMDELMLMSREEIKVLRRVESNDNPTLN